MPNLRCACLGYAMSVDVGSNSLTLLRSGDSPGGTSGVSSRPTGGRTGSREQVVCVTDLLS